MCPSLIRNSDDNHSCLNPGVFFGWRGEQHAASKDALKRQKWLTCFPSRGQRHNLIFTDIGLSLGEVKPALWAQEEELCFLVEAECTLQNSPALLTCPPLGSSGLWGHRWRLHSTPWLLYLVFNHTVKEFSLQGPTGPCCLLHPQRQLRPPSASLSPGSVLQAVPWGQHRAQLMCFPSLGDYFVLLLDVWCLKTVVSYVFQARGCVWSLLPQCCWKSVFIFDLWPYIHHLRMKFLPIIGSIPVPLSFLMPVPYHIVFIFETVII